MSRKQNLKPYKMFDAESIGGGATSKSTSVRSIDKAHIFVEWTGTSPSGTLAVQARHADSLGSGNWFSLEDLDSLTISGNSGSHQILLTELPFSELRLVYTRISGTGSMTATIEGKSVGA